MLRIILVVFCILICIMCTEEPCPSGDIAIRLGASGTVTNPENVLPAKFPYTIQQQLSAITGKWIHSVLLDTFQIELPESLVISYNLSEEGQKCGPTMCRSRLLLYSNKNSTAKFNCIWTTYESLNFGELEILAGNVTACNVQVISGVSGELQITGNCTILQLQGGQFLQKFIE